MQEAEKQAYQNVYWGQAHNWNIGMPQRVDDGLAARLGRNATPGCLRMVDIMGDPALPSQDWLGGPHAQIGDAGTCTQA